MNLNGVELELEFDIFDADTAEKYENALAELATTDDKIKDCKTSEQIRIQCNSVFKFFNDMFGEGTDKKIFGNRTNLKVCLRAFYDLVDFVDKSIAEEKELKNKFIEMKTKYSPNRALRRAK